MEYKEGRLGVTWTGTEYHPPLGLPQFWRDEETGELQRAVLTYLGYKGSEAPAPDERQIDLLRDYLIHYIEAPAWSEQPQIMQDLSSRAREICSAEDVGDVIEQCLEIGLDPL